MSFTYSDFTSRNIGFVTEIEQAKLKNAHVFVAGVGGMGGAAVACLARLGIENFIIADMDVFETSNLNRQIFAKIDVVGQEKTKVAVNELKNINPHINVQVYNQNWTEDLDSILTRVSVVINGCDDVKATVTLLRMAKKHSKTVIDAFASTIPSVYTVRPEDPRPEETFNYPSRNKKISDVSAEEWKLCAQKEIEYVLVHSSTANHVVLEIAGEMISGKRKRMSFAPMVWMTGCLMAYEAVKVILDKKTTASHKGVFINPWTFKIEKPHGWIMTKIRKHFVNKFMESL